jgi:hypothetical protein
MVTLSGSGILAPGEAEYFDIVLQGQRLYSIYVYPSEPGVDFDLYIYDENGNLVEQDTETDSDALCIIAPRWTGPFRLEVQSARGLSPYSLEIEELETEQPVKPKVEPRGKPTKGKPSIVFDKR